MLVLLPPSEGKTAPADGAPVELDALACADVLGAPRERVLAVLARMADGRPATAMKALDLGPGQAEWVGLNGSLLEAPAAPAREVYTGVLYQLLDLASIPSPAHPVLIASALWGVVSPDDRIPAYKLPIGARLPRMKGLAAWWNPFLSRALPADGLVLDLRSGAYAAAWRPARGELVGVRAFTPDGKTISHMAKAVRGQVARAVLQAGGAEPSTPEDLLEVVVSAGLQATLAGAPGKPTLDVVTDRTGWV